MKTYFAREALLPSGWARDVRITVEDGTITAVEPGAAAKGAERLAGPVLPGMANLHSHAFQRAMAGLTEVRAAAHDDFWSWRELMYQFMERLTPEQAQAIAAQLYIEMLQHGYTAVAEFHYVHHPSEMVDQHLAAARDTGIAITLLPSLYRWSGFGAKPLEPRQRRFASDVRTVLDIAARVPRSADVNAGVAPHSLRAVDPESLKALVAAVDERSVIHIHAAEQTREVEECTLALHKRPVEWLLENCPVDGRWCLVHATHLHAAEATGLAASGAVAGLCPTTEANLGDGIFALIGYRGASGRWGIGGDSHVSRDPAEELRLLEYVQRLVGRRRNINISSTSAAVGTTLWLEAAAGGAQALGREMGALAPGKRGDLVVLDGEHPDLAPRTGDAIANALVFSGVSDLVRDVMVAGRWVVRERRHALQDKAAERYARAVAQLLA
ncbi:MAG TPA: formimidoylglutamate deiminase [Burkholderiales bacterium]|nr:formimidoylglutamate deiminase [Burkholderiales bacterium]